MDYRIIYVGAQTVYGVLFLTLLYLRHVNDRGKRPDKLDVLYVLFAATVALDATWMLINGVPEYRVGHIFLQIAYLCIMAVVGYLWFLYTLDFFPTKSMALRKYRFVLGIPVLVQIALVISSVRTGLVFIVDENGLYTRGPLHMYSVVGNYLYMLLGSFVALRCRKDAPLSMDKRRFSAAALFPVPVLFLSLAQMILPPGLPGMQGGVLVGLLLHFGVSQSVKVTQDHLTGLPNRFAFEQDLLEHIRNYRAGGPAHLYLLEGDLNNFKAINDTYGHPMGDVVLKETAKVLNRVFGSYGAAVFRTGGDEFMMVAEQEEALNVDVLTSQLNAELANVKLPSSFALSMSLGMEEYDGTVDFRGLIENVDKKLYAAKRTSK